MKKNKNTIAVLCALALCAITLIGGTLAYLTDTEVTSNKFTIGKVDIDLTEPNWNEEENQQLEAGVTVKKDPTIKNTGINDAYTYLQVQIPQKSVVTADKNGVRENDGAPVLQPIFAFTANQNWSLIKKETTDDFITFVYSYDKILKPGESTNPLFNTVTLANVIEGQIDTQTFEIPVEAFAIQTANTGDGSGNIPSEALAAYQKYLQQSNN